MNKVFATLISIALLIALPLNVLADNHEKPPALDDVWLVVPKKGMEMQFEGAVKAEMAWRAKQEETRSWDAYTPVLGDNMSIYMFRSGSFDWPDMDAYIAEDGEKGFGQHWGDNVGKYVDHYHHYFERMDWDDSYWPEDADFNYFGVTTWVWKEDAGPESSEARKMMSKLALENGWGEQGNNWLWHSRIGGAPQLKLVSGYKGFADMAPPEQSFYEFLSVHLGSEEEASDIFEAFGSGFQSSSYVLWGENKALSSPSGD